MTREEYLIKVKAYEATREQLIKIIGDLHEDNEALSGLIDKMEGK